MSHRSGLDHVNREHASRNKDHGEGMRSTASEGGSMTMHQTARSAKSPSMGGSSDAKKLGKVSAGKLETMKGKTVS